MTMGEYPVSPVVEIAGGIPKAPRRFKPRRPHTKSRYGCQRCKQLKVKAPSEPNLSDLYWKCDEKKPTCQKCLHYDLPCVYSKDRTTVIQTGPRDVSDYAQKLSNSPTFMSCSVDPIAAGLIDDSLRRPAYAMADGSAPALSRSDIRALLHFQSSTCYTLATTRTQEIYRNQIVTYAVKYPYLLHGIVAFALLHLRFLNSPTSRPSRAQLVHWQEASRLFRIRIQKPLNEDDADAVIGTAVLLNGIAFAFVDASNPRQAWPMSDSEGSLEWLAIRHGAKAVLVTTQRCRVAAFFLTSFFPPKIDRSVYFDQRPGKSGVPAAFAKLCEIDKSSTVNNNPYLAALRFLAPLLRTTCTTETVGLYLNFLGVICPELCELLKVRDHRALIIVAYWHALVCRFEQWWVHHRASIECTAICMYLEDSENDAVRDLLPFPDQACGYVLEPRGSSEVAEHEFPRELAACNPM